MMKMTTRKMKLEAECNELKEHSFFGGFFEPGGRFCGLCGEACVVCWCDEVVGGQI